MDNVIIIGVAGGSGSGKTTFARRLVKSLGNENCAVLAQDSYYIDQSDKFDKDGGAVNFDHPSALDFDLMAQHLQELKSGQSVEVPIYDFATHSRKIETTSFPPKKVIFVDGILIFSQEVILPTLDFKIFVDCPEQLRFDRRLKRDVVERGRTPEGVKEQFTKQVKPMHDQFVEPSKDVADELVNEANFDEKLEAWQSKLISDFVD